MGAFAPSCSTCGAVLSGYGWNKELSCMVHFCPNFQVKEGLPRPPVKLLAAEEVMLDEAA